MRWDVEGQNEGRLQATRRRNAAAASARNGPTTSSRREVSGIAHSYHCPDEQIRRFRGCPSLARGIEDRGQHRYLRIHGYVAAVAALELCFKISYFGRRGRRRSCRLGMQVALMQLSGACILHSRCAPKVSVRPVLSATRCFLQLRLPISININIHACLLAARTSSHLRRDEQSL